MRLQKFLAEAGFGSRRKCEELISAGRVLLNGRPATMGDVVDPEKDRVKVDDSTVRANSERLYLVMNKPREVLCAATDARGRRTVFHLLPSLPVRVHTVGRLDFMSEGLLLLTNDGDLTRRLTHPSGGIERVYEVKIQGEVAEWAITKITKGIPLEDGIARAAACKRLRVAETNAWLRVTMSEGKYREIRRMFKAIGFNVLKLKRVRFGPIRLGALIPGQVRELTAAELETLMDPDKARRPVKDRDEEKSPVPKPRKKTATRRDAPPRAERTPRGDRPERTPRTSRPERTPRGDRPERTSRGDRTDRASRGGKAPVRETRSARPGPRRAASSVESAPEGVRKLVGRLEKALASEPRDDGGGKAADGRVKTYTGSRSGYSRTPRSPRTGPSSSRPRGTGGRGSGRSRV